jgi:hypothetical protein
LAVLLLSELNITTKAGADVVGTLSQENGRVPKGSGCDCMYIASGTYSL